jgi:glycosyltransferase involved in cell wall biosynthesis
MACGVCVVVSDAGGNPEIVGQGGEAGLVFRAGDAADLAAKIRDLASDPPRRAAMRRAARERIVDNFTMQKMVDGYIRVYDELAV